MDATILNKDAIRRTQFANNFHLTLVPVRAMYVISRFVESHSDMETNQKRGGGGTKKQPVMFAVNQLGDKCLPTRSSASRCRRNVS